MNIRPSTANPRSWFLLGKNHSQVLGHVAAGSVIVAPGPRVLQSRRPRSCWGAVIVRTICSSLGRATMIEPIGHVFGCRYTFSVQTSTHIVSFYVVWCRTPWFSCPSYHIELAASFEMPLTRNTDNLMHQSCRCLRDCPNLHALHPTAPEIRGDEHAWRYQMYDRDLAG